jgi:hypothetical protein
MQDGIGSSAIAKRPGIGRASVYRALARQTSEGVSLLVVNEVMSSLQSGVLPGGHPYKGAPPLC